MPSRYRREPCNATLATRYDDESGENSKKCLAPYSLVHVVSRRAGLFDYVEFRAASHSRPLGFCLPFHATRSAFQIGFSELNPPAQRSLCLRCARYLTITNAKLEARMVRYSFPVGLFHPLPYAGLSRRTAWHQVGCTKWAGSLLRKRIVIPMWGKYGCARMKRI